jgi:hypothetical protein
MPAETHQHVARADTEQLIDLVVALVAPDDSERPHRDASLNEVGLADEALRWALWDAIVEEFGERSSADVDDPDDLISAQSVGDLIDAFANWLGWTPNGS